MDLKSIKSIKLASLKEQKEVSTNLSEFTQNAAVNFVLPDVSEDYIGREEQLISSLLESMYSDLLYADKSMEYIGIWININNEIFENSMKVEILNDMKKYGHKDVNPIYEFFRMTYPEIYLPAAK